MCPGPRRRGALPAASIVATIAAVLAVSGAPASADWQSFGGTPTCDCVVQDTRTNTYRAVFGYVTDSGSSGRMASGANNRVEFSGGTAGSEVEVTETFDKGTHKATFATGWLPRTTQATCGKDVSLPAGGNGSGPLLAGLTAGAVVLWRRRKGVPA